MTKTEAQTRSELIDRLLAQSGWNVKDPTQVIEEFDILSPLPEKVAEPRTRYEGHQFSDYVLLGKDRKPLAVIEAKKTARDAALGREQAKQYCYNIQKQLGGELPFCFYTNGHETYFWDLENMPPRKVVGFPTRGDLERFAYIRRNRKPLTQEFINTAIAGRDYQIRAIRSVLEGIEQKKRDFLLVMATGTGKTRTCIAMVDALMRAGHAEKVLFLVDRIALREQALAAFKEHMPNEPRWPNAGEKLIATDRRVYVATYPTMLNIIRDESQHLSPHFFDFIVVDESHRSIYNTFGEVLDYFKTITLGLTATPTDIIDHNTFQLFHCEDGLPTFAYTFEEAVNIMRITNVQKGIVVDDDPKFIPDEIANKANNFKLTVGDILISLTGNVGRVGVIRSQHLPAVLNQRVGLIRPSSEEINDKYLFQYLNSDQFEREAIQNSNGVAQLNLSSKWIENYEISLPPLDDQIRIAHLLGKVEGLIAQRKQHLQQLDDLLKSVFLEMFGRFDEWPSRSLSAIAVDGKGTFSNGPFGRDLLTSELMDTGVPVIYIRDIREARYERVSTVYVTEEKALALSACLVQPGDILVAKVGDPPGTTAIYPKGEPVGVVTQDVIRLRPNTGIVNAEFVVSFLNSHIGCRLIHGITVEATRARFGLREFKMQEIPVPPINLQIKFAAIVEKVKSLRSRYQRSLIDLESLYGALSQQAFKGELDLSRVPLPGTQPEEKKVVTVELQGR